MSKRVERRVKVAYVSPDELIELFTYEGTGFPYLRDESSTNILKRAEFIGLPKDARVANVSFDYSRSCFELYLEHDSFPVLESEYPPPLIDTILRVFLCDGQGKEIQQDQSWRDLKPLF